MSGWASNKAFKFGAWGAAILGFVAWQQYDKKHPQEFSPAERAAWNDRIKLETSLGAKPPQLANAKADTQSGEQRPH